MAVVSQKGNHSLSGTPTQNRESHCRPGISLVAVNGQVEAKQRGTGILEHPQDHGSLSFGPICQQVESSIATVCQLETRPIRPSSGCTLHKLDEPERLRLSTICLDREMSSKSSGRQSNPSTRSSHLEHSALVSKSPQFVDQSPNSPAKKGRSTIGSIQQAPPNERSSVSCMEDIRQLHVDYGISERSSRLILAGWSKGINTAYQSAWSKWHSWCIKREVDSISYGVQPFLDFLAELFEQGLQHRTINLIQSAVSITHIQVEGVPQGQHPLVSCLMQGIYNCRPPQPHYSFTWDIEKVITHLQTLGDNNQLTLKALSKKLVLLMVVTDASRSSELQALDIRFRVFKPEGIYFIIDQETESWFPS